MPPRITRKSYRPRASDRTMVDNVQPRSLSCFRIRKRRHENRMDLRRANTPEPLNMTWAGERSEHFCSFQSPGLSFPLTLPFIERAYRTRPATRLHIQVKIVRPTASSRRRLLARSVKIHDQGASRFSPTWIACQSAVIAQQGSWSGRRRSRNGAVCRRTRAGKATSGFLDRKDYWGTAC